MQLKNLLGSRVVAVTAGAAVIATLGASAGFAAATINSGDIVDNSIRSQDVQDGGLKIKDLSEFAVKQLQGQDGADGADGTDGTDGVDGQDGADGADGADATYVGPNWSIVDRNTIGNGDSALRAGPDGAPFGVGSLGLRTGSGTDKAAFGNQVDFLADPLAGIDTVSFWVFTTGENIRIAANNLASVNMEIDPSGPAQGPSNYSTLNFVAADSPAGWSKQDASTAKTWYLTGAAGTASSCNQTTYCTLDEVQAFYPEATILTVQLGKGRDNAFSGAVDGLQINDDLYDFEPLGVTKSAVTTGR